MSEVKSDIEKKRAYSKGRKLIKIENRDPLKELDKLDKVKLHKIQNLGPIKNKKWMNSKIRVNSKLENLVIFYAN